MWKLKKLEPAISPPHPQGEAFRIRVDLPTYQLIAATKHGLLVRDKIPDQEGILTLWAAPKVEQPTAKPTYRFCYQDYDWMENVHDSALASGFYEEEIEAESLNEALIKGRERWCQVLENGLACYGGVLYPHSPKLVRRSVLVGYPGYREDVTYLM